MQVNLQLARSLDHVLVDRVQIQQVFLNLLRNAMESMQDAPRRELTVSTGAVPGDLIAVRVSWIWIRNRSKRDGEAVSAVRHDEKAGDGGWAFYLSHHRRSTWRDNQCRGQSRRRHYRLRYAARRLLGRDEYMTREKVVCVIDDDGAARESLTFLLETDGFVVEAYELAVAFIDAGPPTRGSCIVTDVRMPGMNGIAMLRELRVRGDTRPVIVVTGHADIPLAIEAISSGAFDFIEKPFEADLLLGLVRAALDPRLGYSVIELAKKDVEERFATLTDRERQVFERIVLGQSNASVARDLALAERSVDIHRANVNQKWEHPIFQDWYAWRSA